MLQGDQDWWQLAREIADEDRLDATAHNARATFEHRLQIPLGPVPFVGAIATAPVVLLLSHPVTDARSVADDYTFRRPGWPLAGLHADAPPGLGDCWRRRVAALIALFGAQHVANAIAAVYLTPWHSLTFDARLRLKSRQRMLEIAATAAKRDAIVVLMQGTELWTEHPSIASLPTTRCLYPKSWRGTELSRRNLGDGWTDICRRIEIHAW